MKKTDILNPIEQTLRQASATREGFLGSDERSLAAILRADAATVRRRGLTHARIAQRLLALRQAGWEGLGEPVSVPRILRCAWTPRGANYPVRSAIRARLRK